MASVVCYYCELKPEKHDGVCSISWPQRACCVVLVQGPSVPSEDLSRGSEVWALASSSWALEQVAILALKYSQTNRTLTGLHNILRLTCPLYTDNDMQTCFYTHTACYKNSLYCFFYLVNAYKWPTKRAIQLDCQQMLIWQYDRINNLTKIG